MSKERHSLIHLETDPYAKPSRQQRGTTSHITQRPSNIPASSRSSLSTSSSFSSSQSASASNASTPQKAYLGKGKSRIWCIKCDQFMSVQEYTTHGCIGHASIVQHSNTAGKMPRNNSPSTASSESGSLRRSGRKRSQPVLYTYSAEEQSGETAGRGRLRKRRQTGRSRTSSRERIKESLGPTCPVCQQQVPAGIQDINEHIDSCLAGTSTSESSAAVDNAPVVEYEWGGQTRIRATALFEGGLSAELGAQQTSHVGRDEDVDVDAEDERSFGTAQYSDADLVFGQSANGRGYVGAAPMWEEQPLPLDNIRVARETHAQDAARGVAGGSLEALQLVVDSLRAHIREQDKLIKATKHCTICLEAYAKPCVSVNCWHVYCEACWLRTLGSKKLCPQCLQITQPSDLRRIYM